MRSEKGWAVWSPRTGMIMQWTIRLNKYEKPQASDEEE